MKEGFKRTIAFLFFLLAGIAAGTVIAGICSDIPFLSWLGHSVSIGIDTGDPVILDLIVVRLAFGFIMSVNLAQILCVIAALILYKKVIV